MNPQNPSSSTTSSTGNPSDQKALSRSSAGEARSSAAEAQRPRSGSLQRRQVYPSSLGAYDLFRASPFSLMRRMSEDLDRFFQDFNSGLEIQGRQGSNFSWSPAIEVLQRDGRLLVQCELPGISPNEVKVEVANDSLTIQGERRSEREENERGVHRSERQYGSFYRSIPLPEGADFEHASARFQNGLLEITVPTPQQRENRRSIPIEGGTGSQATSQAQSPTQTGQTDTRRQAA